MAGVLDGKVGLIVGVANKRSIAWAIAQAAAREGATLVQDAVEIAELIAPLDQRVRSKLSVQPHFDFVAEAGDGERNAIFELLSPNFAAVDELVRLSGMPSAQVQMVLLELELAGRLERGAGARVRLTA